MAYINVGATVDGERPKTKTALRRALRERPDAVLFDETSELGASANGSGYIRGDELPTGHRLQVCGPDPYEARKWHATVELVDGVGKVTC